MVKLKPTGESPEINIIMDLVAFGAVATAVTGLILLISVLFIGLQNRELRGATYAKAFQDFVALFQRDEIQMALRTLWQLEGKQLQHWSNTVRERGS